MTGDRLSIATFNCEWRKVQSSDAAVIRERIAGNDVVCLTETYEGFMDGDGHSITSKPFDNAPAKAGRRKAVLWSKNPWMAVDVVGPPGIPPGRFVAGTTETRLGEIRFLGVCIPYGFAGVRFGLPRRKPWELHLSYLEALNAALDGRPTRTIVLGDFNQRVPRTYQPHAVFDALQATLLTRFKLATGGRLLPIDKPAIDHICHSTDLRAGPAQSLSNLAKGGRTISDHFGVQVDLLPKQK